ncbi:hypothetical protein BB561_000007 [Smittium simulii]|uniref:Uncharacterized protein n=1 Tax=Smittium simulii TaxID=133385 RepID=A0A2T9Z0Y3_9FUNG|nr:hypothetical protein BB561_000007 [Smittium simulii]
MCWIGKSCDKKPIKNKYLVRVGYRYNGFKLKCNRARPLRSSEGSLDNTTNITRRDKNEV